MPERRAHRRLLITLVVSVVLAVGGNFALTGWLVGRNNAKFCAVLGAELKVYRDNPPRPGDTERVRDRAQALERLYGDLGCKR